VKIKVMDFDNNPLEHAFVFVGIDKNLRKETNKNGIVEFKFNKENFIQDFIITYPPRANALKKFELIA
jgi:hypothetical protein